MSSSGRTDLTDFSTIDMAVESDPVEATPAAKEEEEDDKEEPQPTRMDTQEDDEDKDDEYEYYVKSISSTTNPAESSTMRSGAKKVAIRKQRWDRTELAAFLSENIAGLDDKANAEETAALLLDAGCHNENMLLNANRETLKEAKIKPFRINSIMNWIQKKKGQRRNTAPVEKKPVGMTLEDFKSGREWEAIKKELDGLEESNFKFSTLPHVEFNSHTIPFVRKYPSLLLYGLTADDRYNGAAQDLRQRLLQDDTEAIMFQAVSGAGKTRALLDVWANPGLQTHRSMLYFDLCQLRPSVQQPPKNFRQDDIEGAAHHLEKVKNDRERATSVFKVLFVARFLVINYLKKERQWGPESILFSQLCFQNKEQVCRAAAKTLRSLVEIEFFDYSSLRTEMIVAIDETNVALSEVLGQYQSNQDSNTKRPLLCCIGDAMVGFTCVFSGTSFSLSHFDEAVASNVGRGGSIERFSSMTRMKLPSDVECMMTRFGINIENELSNNGDLLALLTGRCQLVARAITDIIESRQSLDNKSVVDIIKGAISTLENELSKKMSNRLEEGSPERTLVQSFLLSTLLGTEKTYSNLTEAERKWVDKSFVWITGKAQTIQFNEPILVRSAKEAFGGEWDPVKWIVSRTETLHASQQGIDFEQIAARQVAQAYSLGTLSFAGKDIETAPDPKLATTLTASKEVTLEDFLQTPQTAAFFLPANKDGPDVVFWMMCKNGEHVAVLIQAKYYAQKISGKKTKAAVETVMKSVVLPNGSSVLRIFFPFEGATYTSDPNLLNNKELGDGAFLYLDKDNDGNKVLGDDLCRQLLQLKTKRKDQMAKQQEDDNDNRNKVSRPLTRERSKRKKKRSSSY